jgi:hypothetical protein
MRQYGKQTANRQLSTITITLDMATCHVKTTGNRGELSPCQSRSSKTSAVP